MASFDEDDKEYFKLIVQTSMSVAMKPIADELATHSLQLQELRQTTYGVTLNNGMRSDVEQSKRDIQNIKDAMIDIEEFKVVKDDVYEVKTAQTKMFAYVSAAASFITLAGALFGEKFKKMLGVG